MTTDLRAALRDTATAWDALGMRAAQPECDSHPLVNPDHCAARARQLRALADAPPTVAELLPLVDATHEVRWTTCGEERRIYSPDGGALVVVYRTGRAPNHYTSWHHMDLTVHDLTQPATLVEVTP